jgi:hypothetical protein
LLIIALVFSASRISLISKWVLDLVADGGKADDDIGGDDSDEDIEPAYLLDEPDG